METTMNKRHTAIFGLAALGLALAAPVQAAPNFMDDAFIVAQRDRGDELRQDPRDARRDAQSEREKRRAKRAAERDEPDGYGYGYERRHQQQGLEEDGRPRGRR
jgi:hypothetical protein